MPEVSEVCVTAQWLNKKLKDNTLNSIEILSGRYTHQDLQGKEIIGPSKLLRVKSKGKLLWMKFADYIIMNTFGLAGNWTLDNIPNNRIKFNFDNKTIFYNDPRNFGTFKVITDKQVLQKKIDGLGQDLLQTKYKWRDIRDRIKRLISKRRDRMLVVVLMDQTLSGGIGSGIGNYLSAEIMYDAKLAPKRKISTLDKEEIKTLTKSIKSVIKRSYVSTLKDFKISGKEFHKHVHENFSPNFEFKVYGQKRDPLGNKVTREEIIKGRTTHWVMDVQK